MGPFEAIVVLIIVGFLMLAAEVFVPGMVLGLLGGICLAGAVTVAFVYYDVVTGSIVFAGVCLLTSTGFVAWLAVFPQTAIGRRIMLQKSLVKGVGERTTAPVRADGSTGPFADAAASRRHCLDWGPSGGCGGGERFYWA